MYRINFQLLNRDRLVRLSHSVDASPNVGFMANQLQAALTDELLFHLLSTWSGIIVVAVPILIGACFSLTESCGASIIRPALPAQRPLTVILPIQVFQLLHVKLAELFLELRF